MKQFWSPITIADGLRHSARNAPKKIALIQDEYRATFSDLDRRASRVANAMIGMGLSKGDHVAAYLPNVAEYVEIIFGLAKAGIVPAAISARAKPAEASKIIADAGARAIFATQELVEQAQAALDEAGPSIPPSHRVQVRGNAAAAWTSYYDMIRRASESDPFIPVGEEDLFSLPYTAGTTGEPKGVMLSHRSRALLMPVMSLEYGYSPINVSLATAPMHHGAGLAWALCPIFIGATTVLMRQFDPELLLRLVSEHRITDFFGVPTMFHAVFALPDKTRARYDTSSVDVIVSNAAPLPQASKSKIIDFWPNAGLHETYGSTEGAIVTNLRPPDQLRKESCVGLPFFLTEVKLVDDQGNEVPPGEVGELFSRSPFLFSGYYNKEQQTSDSLSDGFFSSGDLARRDEEGYVYIVDRKKDMIISGGVNIYPRETEEVLHQHSAVIEAACIGVPDDYWGEAMKAVVVLRPGQTVGEDQLIAWCRERLSDYKVPKSVDFIEELPRNPAGKILKRQLRDPHWAGIQRKV